MRWRKWNRWLHRELGYLFFGMSIIYGISGIALNHHVARHWDADIISRSDSLTYSAPLSREMVDSSTVEAILTLTGEVDLPTGQIHVTTLRHRPLFREVDYLHYNKPKKLWTWFSDLFALSLILMAISGIIMLKGKKGLTGHGGILTLVGIIIPLIFLVFYLWL